MSGKKVRTTLVFVITFPTSLTCPMAVAAHHGQSPTRPPECRPRSFSAFMFMVHRSAPWPAQPARLSTHLPPSCPEATYTSTYTRHHSPPARITSNNLPIITPALFALSLSVPCNFSNRYTSIPLSANGKYSTPSTPSCNDNQLASNMPSTSQRDFSPESVKGQGPPSACSCCR